MKEGRSNTSDVYNALVKVVAEIIRNEAHALIGGRPTTVARSIVSHLASLGMRP